MIDKKPRPWDEGYSAAQNGAKESDNPYDFSNLEERDDHSRWSTGWHDYTYTGYGEENYCGGY